MKRRPILIILAVLIPLAVWLVYYRYYSTAQFTPEKWRATNGLSEDSKYAFTHFPKRESILDDLLEEHELTGKTYRQIYRLLGQYDERIIDTAAQQWTIRYQVLIDYEWNIDPQHTVDLAIVFPLKNGICTPDARSVDHYVDDYRAR